MSGKNDIEERRSEIKINRRMRKWNKYKNYCIAGGSAVAVILVVIICFKLFSGGKGSNIKDNKESQTASVSAIVKNDSTETTDIGEQITGSEQPETVTETEIQTEEQTESAVTAGKSFVVTASAVEEEYTSREKFAGSVFLGDTVVGGMSFYRYLDENQVVSDNNMTSDKSINFVDQVIEKNPEKVFIMLGLNDANYENRTVETVVSNIEKTVALLKEKKPSVSIYLLAATPVSSAFEARANINVRQSFIDEMNIALEQKASEIGAVYIDAATCFKDSSGYMRTECTGNGSTVVGSYYAFLLNGIAGAL